MRNSGKISLSAFCFDLMTWKINDNQLIFVLFSKRKKKKTVRHWIFSWITPCSIVEEISSPSLCTFFYRVQYLLLLSCFCKLNCYICPSREQVHLHETTLFWKGIVVLAKEKKWYKIQQWLFALFISS